MKKILILLTLVFLSFLIACTNQPSVEKLYITGTKDYVVFSGETVNLLEGISVFSEKNESYINQLSITSNNCTILDNTISSTEVIDCNVTYFIKIKDVSITKNTTVSFIESLRNLTKIEEFNNLRIYQIYVSAFQDGIPNGYEYGYGPSNHSGDLQGIINALPYIEGLGMNAIWLTPVFESKDYDGFSEYEKRGRSTGYFADDYYNIDPNFGTNELFRTLVDEAHALGLYVFLDGVFGHHGYYPISGVTDGKSQWYGSEIEYPESLDYFIDVATYWIDEYEIDGWRLDQAYQLYQDDYNYFRDIRNAVEDLCQERKDRGETWGTLGYMVAEVWDNPINIQKYAYDLNAFRSAFDFPIRYQLVRTLAVDESSGTSSLIDLESAMNYTYSYYAQPNLFISNHDTLRFGDLLQIGGFESEYYDRHKLAFSFLAQYTGPITLYYGDEYGDEFTGLTSSISELNAYPYIAQDNVARTNGKISNFSSEQQDLIDYLSNLMLLRSSYDSLWNGVRDNLYVDDSVYIELKTSENNQILYVLNISNTVQSITIQTNKLNGAQLNNLFLPENLTISGNNIVINIPPLTAYYYLVQ